MNKQPAKAQRLDLFLKIFLVVATALAGVKIFWNSEPPSEAVVSDLGKTSFAICLMEKGAVMYGVDTCEYCQIQKKMFGSSFAKINYVNCDFDQAVCQSKGITKYPVWEIAGRQMLGIQNFDRLSQTTNCVAPK